MNEPLKETIQTGETPLPPMEKKPYVSPACEQHQPLDHVRTWQTKSLPA